MDTLAQVSPIYPIPAEGTAACKKATPYPEGCEGMPKTASHEQHSHKEMQSDIENSSPKELLHQNSVRQSAS